MKKVTLVAGCLAATLLMANAGGFKPSARTIVLAHDAYPDQGKYGEIVWIVLSLLVNRLQWKRICHGLTGDPYSGTGHPRKGQHLSLVWRRLGADREGRRTAGHGLG
jgi:hypothetical protein